jgi:hypothetical protein
MQIPQRVRPQGVAQQLATTLSTPRALSSSTLLGVSFRLIWRVA